MKELTEKQKSARKLISDYLGKDGSADREAHRADDRRATLSHYSAANMS